MRRMLRTGFTVGIATLCLAWQSAVGNILDFSATERAAILAHGPWPPPLSVDTSNRASGNPVAVELGKRLFFDPRLARDEGGSCATCHQPERRFTDGLATAVGVQPLHRNTPSLLNVRLQRWFGWDGASDSLWAQSLRPIVSAREMGSNIVDAANLVAGDTLYRRLFTRAYAVTFGELDAEQTFVLAGKALAAYQETLISPRTGFDDFRDALASGYDAAKVNYPLSAQRGLRVFVGKGRCSACHVGPNFSNGGFADVGIALAAPTDADPGRYDGIRKLHTNRYNLLGEFNDDPLHARVEDTRGVRRQPGNRGQFRIPSLRGVAGTAPFMHNGSLSTLTDVVNHYSRLDMEITRTDQAVNLRPLNLRADETVDLVAFLRTLGGDG